jgi:putative hemolysin
MKRLNSNPVILALSALAVLMLISAISAAQQSSSDPAHSYCVKMGYLYKTSPGVNNGNGVCQFPDQSWCDAQAFYSGTCGPRLNVNPFGPTIYSASIDPNQFCRNQGGSVRNVHTPYGDVLVCVFPDGSTCDLQSLSMGKCGDHWFGYAYNWLNAP